MSSEHRQRLAEVALILVAVAGAGCGSHTPAAEPAAQDGGGQAPDGPVGPTPPQRIYDGPLFLRRAAAGELASFARDHVTVAGSGELVLEPGALAGQDPVPPGSYNEGNYYNGGDFRYGTARSTDWVSAAPFDRVVPSFEATTPPGTWVEIALAVRREGRWTKDYVLGVWASSTGTVARHSVGGQDDVDAAVQIDTLALAGMADALRFTITLFSERDGETPQVRAVAAAVSASGASPPLDQPSSAARGKVLDVPQRSQMLYPDGGELCSPTSTSMLMAYWAARLGRPALDQTVPATAANVFDHGARIRGNWTFNMAHAASAAGGALHAVVTRLASLHQVERLIAADVPVGLSVKSTSGHLLVVRGFTGDGDVVCNDPALPSDAAVRVTYERAELEKRWLSHAQGTTYLIWPAGTELPADPLGAF